MKHIKLLLLTLLPLSVLSCDKSHDNFVLSAKTISQTVWSGKLIDYSFNDKWEGDVTIFFKSNDVVDFTLNSERPVSSTYSIYRNIISVKTNNVQPLMGGDWVVTKQSTFIVQ